MTRSSIVLQSSPQVLPPSTQSKTYIDCPFAEKDDAKKLGARWDPGLKKWFIPPGMALNSFRKWLPAGFQIRSDIGDVSRSRDLTCGQLWAIIAKLARKAFPAEEECET